MVCIWAGTLTATWCIVTLREIVQNMTFWAARFLKPQIASRITQSRSTTSASQPYPLGTISSRTASQGLQTTRKIHVLRSPKAKKPISLPFRGKRIRVCLPIHDERKPGRETSEDSNPEPSLPRSVKPEISGNKPHGKPDVEDNTLDSGIGEPEAPKKSPPLNAEPNYFIYRTLESFYGRRYDSTIWDSEGSSDESYVPSSSEPDSESSTDISLEVDNADDEASESNYSHGYETAYEEQLLPEPNTELERAETPTPSLWGPGQVSKLTLADRDDLMYCAANVISGEEFMRLKSIENLLENLNGVDLLDATWRSLEAWEGLNPNLYSFQMRCLILAITHINDFLALQSEKRVDDYQHHHLTMALRRKDLDQTLQAMQQEGDIYLQELVRLLLRAWNGEKCMEVLSNELLGLSAEEFEKMLQEAFDAVSSDTNLIGTV